MTNPDLKLAAELNDKLIDAQREIDRLRNQVAIAVSALEHIVDHMDRPKEGSTDYQKIMYWSGHQLDSEAVAKSALKKIRAPTNE